MNMDLLVIAGQNTAVNTFSGLVHTARQVSRVGSGRSAFMALSQVRQGALSRNKVSLLEGGDGSPPF